MCLLEVEVIGEEVFILNHGHGIVCPLGSREFVVAQVVGSEGIGAGEVVVKCHRRRKLQPFENLIVYTSIETKIVVGIGAFHVLQTAQSLTFSHRPLTRKERRRFFGVERQSLDFTHRTTRVFVRVGKIGAQIETETWSEVDVQVGEQTEALEVRADHDALFIIKTSIHHIAYVVFSSGDGGIGLRDTSHAEGIFPPVGTVVVERIERVLHNSRQAVFTVEHSTVTPKVVVSSIVVGVPTPSVVVAAGHYHVVGSPVIVS